MKPSATDMSDKILFQRRNVWSARALGNSLARHPLKASRSLWVYSVLLSDHSDKQSVSIVCFTPMSKSSKASPSLMAVRRTPSSLGKTADNSDIKLTFVVLRHRDLVRRGALEEALGEGQGVLEEG
eukprot:CAMPEP_0176154874 /NCGR_PEP_ID=MMETSP0120_2-20121206/79126_1 /TAXON_ID=160619 /ORGANISM="Kryptoperidinium foliaceum, Strain CCMP 1326" /LENGTH=125 /DNA_ID=CAMNT_0017491985 /DNA_START=59 /DNA_END=432 /DNA_ORIENTATION=+